MQSVSWRTAAGLAADCDWRAAASLAADGGSGLCSRIDCSSDGDQRAAAGLAAYGGRSRGGLRPGSSGRSRSGRRLRSLLADRLCCAWWKVLPIDCARGSTLLGLAEGLADRLRADKIGKGEGIGEGMTIFRLFPSSEAAETRTQDEGRTKPNVAR